MTENTAIDYDDDACMANAKESCNSLFGVCIRSFLFEEDKCIATT